MILKNIFKDFIKEKKNIKTESELNLLKSKYLGRNGIINKNFENIKNIDFKDKKITAEILNKIKKKIEVFFKKKHIKKKEFNYYFDITLPGVGLKIGNKHIITKTLDEIVAFFIKNGFNVINGLEIDSTKYNFELLNMPKDHPSRTLKETFYIKKELVLRTHTSNMQIHIMKNNNPPLKIISYGKVYRRDYDTSHTPMFHQLEGFIIDKNISIANLKYTLFKFIHFFFEKKIKIKFRLSYFPFTEPSMEIDIQCNICYGSKCTSCNQTGWIEVLGCGMIHKKVLTNCNINTNIYSGFAFGMGIERLIMIKYRIKDIRMCFENNIDFLKQF